MIIIEIIYNLLALVAVSMIAGFIQQEGKSLLRYRIFQGLIFGSASVLGMLHPLIFSPGLIFDGRSVMISLCGVFFGPVAVVVAAGMALVCRIFQGGVGQITGILVIISSALLGAGFYVLRSRRNIEVTLLLLWQFGLVVHAVMLALMLTLPFEMALSVLKRISLPVIVAYPLATVMIGKVLLDIFDRKRKEEALRRSEADLKEAQLIASLGRWELDIRKSQLYWSDLIFEIFEIDRERFGASYEAFLDVIHPDDRERVNHFYLESLKDKKPYDIEHRLLMKDGRVKWVSEACRTEFDLQGNAVRSVGIVQDITSRKKVQEDLWRAKEAAERAMKAKSEFLNNVAHDFRTPLHAIMGFSAILRLENLTEKQKKLADIMSERSKGLLCLVEDLLDVSRLDSGRLELRSTEIDIRKCVQDAVDVALVELMSKDVKVQCVFPDGITRVKGDETRFNQILSNLIGNAVKYTDKGEIVIRVNFDREASPQGKCRVVCSVKDTGLGIPKESQQQIFDAFTRFHEFDGGKQRGGVGMGLYIVKALVDLMKGSICVVSEVGKGSEFVVTFDFDKAE